MAAPPGDGRRRERLADGMDPFTLRFVDPMREAGYAGSHQVRLAHYLLYSMVAVNVMGIPVSLLSHRFWDHSQYPTREAQELGQWQLLLLSVMFVSLSLAWGAGYCLAKYKLVGTFGLEIIVVSTCTCFMVVMVLVPKPIIHRASVRPQRP
ncbi:unnamed protein product [Prorocentrum cordatum]|uniref:Uncharacterized protein n=1 Tax=Prorocentrum cordatum TaxID=2364126 RepID=A0ABN9QSP4_9DINO|nr:unnamed protein product [Polarella glacialis]